MVARRRSGWRRRAILALAAAPLDDEPTPRDAETEEARRQAAARDVFRRCSGCGADHQRKGQRYCLVCHREANRRYRARKNAEMTALRRRELDDLLRRRVSRDTK